MKYILLAILLLASFSAKALVPQYVEFHNEAQDTVKINQMLSAVKDQRQLLPGERVAEFGKMFLGAPYAAGTLEGDEEKLRVNLDEFDCTTFVETSLAMALTVGERRSAWHDYIYNLERIRYRSGNIKGYPSRLHYVADWAADNIYRGALTDATTRAPKYSYVVKGIDFMSENASKYPALADSANLAGIKKMELGYRNYRIPYIRSNDLYAKDVASFFQEGDIVALVTKIKNLDVTHMGIITIVNGVPHLLHASSANGKVEVSALPLADYMKKNHNLLGVRVFRIHD